VKLLIIGDPHLKITRFDLANQFVNWLNDKIEQVKPDAVVNLGDTFDTHAVVRSEIKNLVMDHIQHSIKYSSTGKYFYILGNHDFYKPKSSKYHALRDWKSVKGLHVIDERTDFPDINTTMIPYYPDHTEFPMDTLSICIAHQTFIGTDYGFKREDVGVNADDVHADIIISGHIHNRQQFGKVVYPGSPFSQTVNDIDQVKGIVLFDTALYKQEFIECPLPRWISLEYEINSDSTIDAIHKDIISTVNDKDHWVVKLSGPKAEIVGYQSAEYYKDLIKTTSIQIKPTFTDKAKRKEQIKASSIDNIMHEYFDKVYDGAIDKDLLKKKSREIIESI
jgi:DNA repair exonuclease SbcCD nuclease subunit